MSCNNCNFSTKEEIGKGIFVYTRDLYRDYDWILCPSYLDKYVLENVMFRKEKEIFFNKYSDVCTSKWYSLKLGDFKLVFRIVRDGRKDNVGRPIRRYEGTVLHEITNENIAILEECLKETQHKTNNFNYGWIYPFEETEKEDVVCEVAIEGAKVRIKSEELAKFIENNSSEGVPFCFVVEVCKNSSGKPVEGIFVINH